MNRRRVSIEAAVTTGTQFLAADADACVTPADGRRQAELYRAEKLLAATPALLAALRELLPVVEKIDHAVLDKVQEFRDRTSCRVARARAAIAKATGE